MPNKNRDAGNNYERAIAIELRELGFPECVTSRSESKRKDDAGVDLCFTDPFNIQCKRWKSAPSYHQVLKDMPKDLNHNVIFHKRPHKGEVVVMSKDTFYWLITQHQQLEKLFSNLNIGADGLIYKTKQP